MVMAESTGVERDFDSVVPVANYQVYSRIIRVDLVVSSLCHPTIFIFFEDIVPNCLRQLNSKWLVISLIIIAYSYRTNDNLSSV